MPTGIRLSFDKRQIVVRYAKLHGAAGTAAKFGLKTRTIYKILATYESIPERASPPSTIEIAQYAINTPHRAAAEKFKLSKATITRLVKSHQEQLKQKDNSDKPVSQPTSQDILSNIEPATIDGNIPTIDRDNVVIPASQMMANTSQNTASTSENTASASTSLFESNGALVAESEYSLPSWIKYKLQARNGTPDESRWPTQMNSLTSVRKGLALMSNSQREEYLRDYS